MINYSNNILQSINDIDNINIEDTYDELDAESKTQIILSRTNNLEKKIRIYGTSLFVLDINKKQWYFKTKKQIIPKYGLNTEDFIIKYLTNILPDFQPDHLFDVNKDNDTLDKFNNFIKPIMFYILSKLNFYGFIKIKLEKNVFAFFIITGYDFVN